MIWRVLLAILRAFALVRPKRVIYVNGTLYLTRWYLTPVDAKYFRRGWWPFREVYLHQFHASDPDRGWHTHPWVGGRSRLLKGTYVESTPRPTAQGLRNRWRVYGAGDVNTIPRAHRVILGTREVWTLFSHGRRHGMGWGFYDHRGVYTPHVDE